MKNKQELLFIDIETVQEFEKLDDCPYRYIWLEKYAKDLDKENKLIDFQKQYENKAPLIAEFGKIVCISMGLFDPNGNIKIKSLIGDEWEILKEFISILNKTTLTLCGHNIKGFDLPFISKRILIKGIKLPTALNFINKKPREVDIVDTMEIWKMGGFLSSGLDIICRILIGKSPKENMSGSQVNEIFYNKKCLEKDKKNIELIQEYCEGDVKCTAELYDTLFNLIN